MGKKTIGSINKWWALVAVCFGLFMSILDITIVNVALPTIQKSLNASFSELQWVIDAYTLTFAVVLVTASRMGDIFGRKKIFIFGLGIFSIGSLLCGLSGDFSFFGTSNNTTLIISRIIQAIGGAAMMPLSLSIISTVFHGKERGMAIGIWGGISGVAIAIGPLIGGYLVQNINWQSIFFINIPIGVIGIILALWAIPESKEEKASRFIDIFGLVTFSVCMFCLVLALIQGNTKGWGSSYIITLFAVALVSLVVFVIGELKIKHPMIDPRLFKIPSFTGSAIAAFALSAGLYSLFFYLTLYLQNFLGFDALAAGIRFLPLSATVLLGAPISGKLIDKFGPKWFLVSSLGALSVSVFMATRISPSNTAADWIILLPTFIIAGIASGMANPPISALAVGTVSESKVGMASGISNVFRQLGMAFGIAFFGAMLSNHYNSLMQSAVNGLANLPAAAKEGIMTGVKQAGTIGGSLGLPNTPGYPAFPQAIQDAAHSSFISGTIEVIIIAGAILLVGAILSAFLIRNKDMVHIKEEAKNLEKETKD